MANNETLIWKYNFDFTDHVELELPENSKILAFGNQYELPTIWVLVPTNYGKIETVTFRLVGTGHQIENENDLQFIGTALFNHGTLVFHLFRVIE